MSLLVHLEYFFSKTKAHEYLKKIPEEASLSEYVKMAALYSDFGERAFHSPKELITEEVARLAFRVAEKRVNWLKSYDDEIIDEEGLLRVPQIDFVRMSEKLGVKEYIRHVLESAYGSHLRS